MRENLKDVIVFLIKCLPVLFIIAYFIFYMIVAYEYRDVPLRDMPAWAAWVLFYRG